MPEGKAKEIEMEEQQQETNGHKQIYGLMATVLSEVGSVAKGRTNEQQGYRFRGIDDVYEAVHPLFAQHKIFTLPRVLAEEVSERTTSSGTVLRFVKLTMAYDFFAPDGSHVTAEVVGEAMDAGDKASNKAMSAAQKYALIQTLCIPCGSPDTEEQTHEVTTGARPISKSNTAPDPCPECGGGMWNNSESKRNPKAPDYKCKNKTCSGAVWLDSKPPSTFDATERAAFFDAIKAAGKTLNKMGDKPEWTLARANAFANDNFNTDKGVDGLTVPQLAEMAQLMSSRIDDLKKKPKGQASKEEEERRRTIAAIVEFEDKSLLQKILNEKFGGKAVADLSLDALVSLQDELYPF